MYQLFSFIDYPFVVVSKKLMSNPGSQIFLLCFLLENFIVLCFVFRSMLCFELMFVYDLWMDFPILMSDLFWHQLLISCPLSMELCLHFCQKSNGNIASSFILQHILMYCTMKSCLVKIQDLGENQVEFSTKNIWSVTH